MRRIELQWIAASDDPSWWIVEYDRDAPERVTRLNSNDRKAALRYCSKWCKAAATPLDPISFRARRKDGGYSNIEWTYPRGADPKRSRG